MNEQIEEERTNERTREGKGREGKGREGEAGANKQLASWVGEKAGERNNQSKCPQEVSKRQEQNLLSPSAVMPAWEKPRMAPKRLQLRYP